MQLVKVAAVALNQTPLDWTSNTNNIRVAISAARNQGATIVCLPELCITGYGCEDAFQSPSLQKRALRILQELVPCTADLMVSVGLPILHRGALYNCVAVLANQKLAGFVAKSQLAGDGIHYEPRWFKPWPPGQVDQLHLDELHSKELHSKELHSDENAAEFGDDDRGFPIGNLVFDFSGVRIGFEICEDAWAANRPGDELAHAAVDFILNPSASHFAFEKQEVRRRLVLEGSRAFGVTYVYANLLGNEAGRAIYDGATMIASQGEMITEGPRLTFTDYEVTTAQVDIDTTRMSRARLASFQPGSAEDSLPSINVDFDIPVGEPQTNQTRLAAWETQSKIKEEEFARAVALGLFDYLRKSHSGGYVVSLSGGADSAAVAVLIWLVVRLGVSQLGTRRFASKLPQIGALQAMSSEEAAVRELLTTVYQATRNSSQTTADAAEKVAQAIGSEHLHLNVDPMVDHYVDAVSGLVGRELDWEQDDLALQNIQARARAPGVWLLANLKNALLVSTSNRSEAAVGYTTMDGDTCGGLSPIAGIDKAFLRKWLCWMRDVGPWQLGHLPVLNVITQQAPTAELRPPSAAQTDEDDLMPFEILDWIERAAIRDKYGPLEIFKLIQVKFPDFSRTQLAQWVKRFFRLWSRNQWKRERYAPSFHLDDENLDPKTWCRFPILSGGFEVELAELQQLLLDEQG